MSNTGLNHGSEDKSCFLPYIYFLEHLFRGMTYKRKDQEPGRLTTAFQPRPRIYYAHILGRHPLRCSTSVCKNGLRGTTRSEGRCVTANAMDEGTQTPLRIG